MNKINKKSNKNKKGFSMVETLIAIFILALGLSAFMSVASSGLQSSIYAKDRVTAFYLAQEAIEVIKNIRDENAIENFSSPPVRWLDGIADWDGYGGPCGSTSDCGVDSRNESITQIDSCNDMNDCVLRRDLNGIFNHAAGEDTKFIRVVNMEPVSGLPNEAKVIATVSWNSVTGSGNLVVEENILNWHPLSDEE